MTGCQCESAGFCARYGIVISANNQAICSAKSCSEEEAESWRQLWDCWRSEQDAIDENLAKCRHLGNFIREGNCNIGCPSIGRGQPFEILECSHSETPNECSVRRKHTEIHSCLVCDHFEVDRFA